jgi:hypothetical protein
MSLRKILLGAMIFAALGPIANSSASSGVYVASSSCEGHAVRPALITLACADGNAWVTNLRYSAYGDSTAWANGTLHYNDCLPYCAVGHIRSTGIRLKLARIIVGCDGRRYYSRATITSPAYIVRYFSGQPWYISPFGC